MGWIPINGEEEFYSLSINKEYDAPKNDFMSSNTNTPNTASNLSNRSASNKRIDPLRSKLKTSSRAYCKYRGRHVSPDVASFKNEDLGGYDLFNQHDDHDSEDHDHMENLVSHVVKDTDSPTHKKFHPNEAFKNK